MARDPLFFASLRMALGLNDGGRLLHLQTAQVRCASTVASTIPFDAAV